MARYDYESTAHAPRLPDAGWLPDPSRTDLERFWDGHSWTARTRDLVSKRERVAYADLSPAPARVKRVSRAGRWLTWTFVMLAAVGALGYLGKLPEWVPYSDAMSRSAPAGPEVAYPVFGSTDLVQYLARSMIAQQASIDLTYWTTAGSMGEAEVTDAMYEVLSQNPYVFADSWSASIGAGPSTVAPTYRYSDDVAAAKRTAVAAAVARGVADSGAASATGVEAKARAIHDYIAKVTTYDNAAFGEISANTASDSPRVQQSQEAYGILVAGTAVCTGYAMAFQAMAAAVGLVTVIVTGTATGLTTGGHAWNRLLLGQAWKTVDVTWDDGDDEGPTSYDYFLVDNNAEVLGTRTADLKWAVDSELSAYGG